jgi:hypothetical protein
MEAMRRTALWIIFVAAFPCASSALSLGLGAHAYGDFVGSLSGGYADFTAERYAELGATSFGSRGSAAGLPLLSSGIGLNLAFKGIFTPRLDAVLCLDFGIWGWGMAGKDDAGRSFAGIALSAPVLDLGIEARYSFSFGSGEVVPGLGPFLGLLVGKYSIKETISGVPSTIDPAPRFVDAPVVGLRASLAYVLRAGPGRIRLGMAGAIGSSLASSSGALAASILWPWRIGLDLGYEFGLRGGRK